MDQVSQSAPSEQASLQAPKKSNTCLVVAIILFIIFIVLAAGGYLIYKKGSGVLKSAVSSITLNPNCKQNDPDLCKFLNNWQSIDYFTANSTSTFEGKEQKSVMKSVGDDKFQMTNITGGSENYNMISIGNTTYTKDYTDGKWLKTTLEPTKSDASATEIKDEFDFNVEEDQTTYKKIGKEACGKLTCFKYQVIDPQMAELNSKEYILFDDKDYLLRKTITEGPDNNLATSEFDYSKITIIEPSPIKEGPTNIQIQSTTSGSSSTNTTSNSSSDSEQTMEEIQQELENISTELQNADQPAIPAEPVVE